MPPVALVLITMVAPVAWGSTYLVTQLWLPEGRPLFSGVVRAIPAGLLLLALTRRLPTGSWWWRSFVLGFFNIGLFFVLLFIAAYRLPSGLAATLTALSPLVVMVLALLLLRERPRKVQVAGGLIGVLGVGLLAREVPGGVDLIGLAAAVGALTSTSLGFVLVKRWPAPGGLLPMTSWTLLAGGLMLVPATLVVEGPPPSLDVSATWAYAYLSAIGTALAYVCWFTGLTRMTAASTALLGLVNPVVGTGLGVAFLAEPFGAVQALGVALVLIGALAGQLRTRRTAASQSGSAPAQVADDPCSSGEAAILSSASSTSSKEPAKLSRTLR